MRSVGSVLCKKPSEPASQTLSTEQEEFHLKLVLADAEDSVVVDEEGDVGELHGSVGGEH